MMKLFAVLFSLLLLASCDSAGSDEAWLTAHADGGKLVLTNNTKDAISYLASEEQHLRNLEIWNYDQLPRLLAREKVEIPYEQILGYTPSATRAVVIWKKVEQKAVDTLRVQLK